MDAKLLLVVVEISELVVLLLNLLLQNHLDSLLHAQQQVIKSLVLVLLLHVVLVNVGNN
jgi:antibiotic biosynthesis monooxygenase (ABM) superfamily enzyme